MTKTGLSQRSLQPLDNEFEVSIFGPGKGEALAVHLGGGDWITVDSCVNQRTQRNALLDYFAEIDVDVSQQVRLVVGTHAHDDHISGIADLFEEAVNSTFICSSAVASEEFLHVVNLDQTIAAGVRPSIRAQYRRVFDEVKARGRGKVSLQRAVEGRMIWSRAAAHDLPAVQILSLSPSDEAVTRALSDLAKSAMAAPGDRKRFTNRDPNEFAVALWVTFGEESVLLGADLPTGPAGCGWIAVMNNLSLAPQASLFKVPHHGSSTGHHQPVWDDLLGMNSVALLAPYRGGHKPLPAQSDVERISGLTTRAYITASPEAVAKKPAIRSLGMTLGGLASAVRDPWGTVGQVRARRKAGDDHWAVELFEPARELGRLY